MVRFVLLLKRSLAGTVDRELPLASPAVQCEPNGRLCKEEVEEGASPVSPPAERSL